MKNQIHDMLLKAVIKDCPDVVAYINTHGGYNDSSDWKVMYTHDEFNHHLASTRYHTNVDSVNILLKYGYVKLLRRFSESYGHMFQIEIHIPESGVTRFISSNSRARSVTIPTDKFNADHVGKYFAKISKPFLKVCEKDVKWPEIFKHIEAMRLNGPVYYAYRVLHQNLKNLQVATINANLDSRLVNELFAIMATAGMLPEVENI